MLTVTNNGRAAIMLVENGSTIPGVDVFYDNFVVRQP